MTKSVPLSEMSKAELTDERERLHGLRRDLTAIQNGTIPGYSLGHLDPDGHAFPEGFHDMRGTSNKWVALGAMAILVIGIPAIVIGTIYFFSP